MRRLRKLPVANVRAMAMFRRRRLLDLRPAAEWHEEFVRKHPDAEQLLAEADEYLAKREAGHNPGPEPQAVENTELID